MTISDLIEKRGEGVFRDAILQCELIAFDARDGKILFETHRNRSEYINQFLDGKIISMWADVRRIDSGGYTNSFSFRPVMKCYVSHNSWIKAANEDDKGGEQE